MLACLSPFSLHLHGPFPDIDRKTGVQLFFNLCNLGAMLTGFHDINLKLTVIVKARLKGSDQLA